MQLRDRQVKFKDKSLKALKEKGNTLGIAPTGAGKTVMLSAIAGDDSYRDARRLVLQHRDELVAQNETTYKQVNPKGGRTSRYDARVKDWSGSAVFAMVPTLARSLDKMEPMDLIVIDEAHHCAAGSYLRLVDQAKKLNPDVHILGVTATPNRGDKKSLQPTFDNVSDQITLGELIKAGHLVKPRTFVVDIGVRGELEGVKRRAADFDMDEVAKIMDKSVLNDKIVEEWERLAGNRQTVVFCSTVEHANHVCEAFNSKGIVAAVISGDMGKAERRKTLEAYDRQEIQVLLNCMVLTEGWDNQPTSCVILLRPSSFKSTMIQMIGRGLRKVNPERYPGVVKDNCIVLDFGTSLLMHDGLEEMADINAQGTIDCPECDATLPAGSYECAICGHEFPREEAETKDCPVCHLEHPINASSCRGCGYLFVETGEKEVLKDIVLTEIDVMNDSPFRWEPMFGGVVMVAAAFDVWAMVVNYNGRWHAVGRQEGRHVAHIADCNDRLLALSTADDYMRMYADQDAGSKTRRWISLAPTLKQIKMLENSPYPLAKGDTRYRAACFMTWRFNEKAIQRKLLQVCGKAA